MIGGNARGFTLVEMLVALASLALVATAGITLTAYASDAQQASAAHDADARELLRLRAALKADLGQASARRARNASGQTPQMALLGPPVTQGGVFLALVRRGWDNPSDQDRSTLQYVEYRLQGDHIERLYRRHLDGAPLQAPQRLLGGVARVDISYLQYDQWIEAFAGSPDRPLPAAVRIDIRLIDGGEFSQLFLLPGGAS